MATHPAGDDVRDASVELGRAWREHRRHLLDIAFRMLGSLSEAEDAVQEAFARLVRAQIDEIDDVGGWLVVVVSRVCLDKLRLQRRHPTAPDDELGYRSDGHYLDPAERITLDDNVRLALHLVLERLTPAERTAFVLHDVFQYPFEAISEIVGRTPAACRQLASRARRNITADTGPSRFRVETAEQRRIAEQFIAACTGGDLEGLLAILDPDVAGEAEIGGALGTITVRGRADVAANTLRFFGPHAAATLLSLPNGDGAIVVGLRHNRVFAVLSLTVLDGRVAHIDGVVDPVKLAPIADALGLASVEP